MDSNVSRILTVKFTNNQVSLLSNYMTIADSSVPLTLPPSLHYISSSLTQDVLLTPSSCCTSFGPKRPRYLVQKLLDAQRTNAASGERCLCWWEGDTTPDPI